MATTSNLILTLVLVVLIFVTDSAVANNYIPKEIDINTADTTVFMALPGIGSKLAARIVAYREKLGGFYNVAQVGETWGLADTTFQKISKWLVVKTGVARKININTASVDEIRIPYINYNLANAIFQYRQQHGMFKSLEDLKKIMLMNDEILNKILPYFTV
jgi:competence ComEA-like helix-hairpin-helix protein